MNFPEDFINDDELLKDKLKKNKRKRKMFNLAKQIELMKKGDKNLLSETERRLLHL